MSSQRWKAKMSRARQGADQKGCYPQIKQGYIQITCPKHMFQSTKLAAGDLTSLPEQSPTLLRLRKLGNSVKFVIFCIQ